jgi:hypothetical protein
MTGRADGARDPSPALAARPVTGSSLLISWRISGRKGSECLG